ncbi:MAG: PQQ-binding-like beta-propeller repeat protein [Gammaproteobacteria bacterium]|jgi:quinoprotein glucose dehydrogenase|nr:PQQ-binding-like beta-propeller repeat protein [Gammaproteobacteria bacterium]MDP6734238.1 PQQ-binding-like beta-propeller repeat protein [Gammaproteobacteria bacterium]
MTKTEGLFKFLCLVLVSALLPLSAFAQLTGVEDGEWRFLGGDAGHTRASPHLTQIDASNFADLQVAWTWRGDNFGGNVEYTFRSTPVFADGILYTVAGQRRQVVAIDAATGETLWTFREPETMRYLRSPRTDFGKGVAYTEVDGSGVVLVTSPAFFLWALDAKTGRPLNDWGTPTGVADFSETGVVDLIPDLVSDWPRWLEREGPYDPDHGIPRQIGMVTASSPPIVVNDVIVVLVGHEPSYDQTRIENVPGDIMGYDVRTGEQLWKFHVIPRPGEFGHETWENDAWQWSGDMSSWAPAAADPELGLVYLVTNASTVQSYAGHRPGHNLFGGSVLALDVATGERRWHFQIHHSDQWNYDIPTAPILMDLNVNGEQIPALIQNTKQGLVFAFNRTNGEPIWPIEERPVMQTQVPGNYTAATQPYPTRPEPLDPIVTDGITEEFLLDYTPELKRQAQEILSEFRVGGLYVPALPYPHNNGYRNVVGCVGGLNIYHPPVADPTTGIMYASHRRGCSAPAFMEATNGVDEERGLPGQSAEAWRGRERHTPTTGITVAEWAPGRSREFLPLIDRLPVYKPLFQGLAAYDMNTGEKLWDIPIGETPSNIKDHPLLQGIDTSATGGTGHSIQMVMGDLLVQTTEDLRGESELNENGMPMLRARDKRTGEILASAEIPIPGQYGMMTYMHEGVQYIVVQSGSVRRGQPGALVGLRLP